MTNYTVQSGDTFASVARKVYGDDRLGARVSAANPGALEPLTAGTTLVVPASPYPTDSPSSAPTTSENEVAISIDGVRFRFWQSMRLVRSVDSMDVLEFNAPFDSTDAALREMFKPFTYKQATVTIGGVFTFTGTVVGVVPRLGASKTLQVSCYALPGVLNDCTAPASAFPLEFNNVPLSSVSSQLCDYFGLSSVFNDSDGAAFERVALSPQKKVLPFLVDLAKQRDLVIANSPSGELTYSRPVVSAPVARLRQGASPLVSIEPFFSPQNYYSHVSGLEPVVVGGAGSQYTVKNSRLAGTIRPITFEVRDAKGGDVKAAVSAKASRMFGSMAVYTAKVSTWRDEQGELWSPGTTVNVEAPDAMVYQEYALLVRNVDFMREAAEEKAVLTLVMPESFNGQIPETLPWED